MVTMFNKTEFMAQVKNVPPALMHYIQNNLSTGVIHIYYGASLTRNYRTWPVRPFVIKPYEKFQNKFIIEQLQHLMLFTFLRNITFMVYNDMWKTLSIPHSNFIVTKCS